MYVAAQREINFPIPSYCRKIQVGAAYSPRLEGFVYDDSTPDNISSKNPAYGELTALYAMWKGCDADIQGIYHYRRYISGTSSGKPVVSTKAEDIYSASITEQAIVAALEDSDLILSSPATDPDWLEMNIAEYYSFLTTIQEMAALYNVIKEHYPDYFPALRKVLSSTRFHSCNMFIARRSFVNDYCTWLFGVFRRLEDTIPHKARTFAFTRTFAFMGEFLLDVYVYTHGLKYVCFDKLFVNDIARQESRLKSWGKKVLHKIPALWRMFWADRSVIHRANETLKGAETSEELRRRMLALGASRSGDFLVLKIRIRSHIPFTSRKGVLMMILLPPDEEQDFSRSLSEVVSRETNRIGSEKCKLICRVILSSKASDSVCQSAEALGAGIAGYF